jgi:hypothetical protein
VGLEWVGESLEEVDQVVGVLSGGIDADGEGGAGVLAGELFEARLELGVAGARLGEPQWGAGRLEVGAEEHGDVAVARGVDTHTDGDRWGPDGGAGCWYHGISRRAKRGRDGAADPLDTSDQKEACDQRSENQDVTSFQV